MLPICVNIQPAANMSCKRKILGNSLIIVSGRDLQIHVMCWLEIWNFIVSKAILLYGLLVAVFFSGLYSDTCMSYKFYLVADFSRKIFTKLSRYQVANNMGAWLHAFKTDGPHKAMVNRCKRLFLPECSMLYCMIYCMLFQSKWYVMRWSYLYYHWVDIVWLFDVFVRNKRLGLFVVCNCAWILSGCFCVGCL